MLFVSEKIFVREWGFVHLSYTLGNTLGNTLKCFQDNLSNQLPLVGILSLG